MCTPIDRGCSMVRQTRWPQRATDAHTRACHAKRLCVSRGPCITESHAYTRGCMYGDIIQGPRRVTSMSLVQPSRICQDEFSKQTCGLWNFYILIREFTYSVRRRFSSYLPLLNTYTDPTSLKATTPKAQWRAHSRFACATARQIYNKTAK